jgi:hypothetical protein
MRIAFAHYSTEDDIGGVSTWLIRLASELRRQGWPVAVLLPHTGNHPARSTIASAGSPERCSPQPIGSSLRP